MCPNLTDETPNKDEPEVSADEAEDGDAKQKGKGLGLIPMVVAGVVAAGVAGGAAFVLTPGAQTVDPACLDAEHAEAAGEHSEDPAHGGDAHGESDAVGEDGEHSAPIEECPVEEHGEDDKKEKKKKKKDDKGHGGGHGEDDKGGAAAIKPIGEVQQSEHATFLVLEPMVVSIQPIGRSKHLKVTLVFETDETGAAVMIDNGFYIQDVLNTYLRSVDHTVLEDPSSMSRLRAQILRRIRTVVPDASVTNVLITEFVLT